MSPLLALRGVRVIELCQIAAGPFAGMLLADMGADVIKVESPEGDGMRNWPPHTAGYSENFASLNRGKRSVVLDLKDRESSATARTLCLSADVVLENFRPGVMQRLGLGYESLAKAKPSLIYCSISAFGQEGPRSQEGGFDVTLQAIGGVMSVTGEPGGAPVKSGVPLTDFAAGLYAAFSITSCLLKTRETGIGLHIDVPMLGTTLAIAALQTSEYFGSAKDPRKLGSAHPRNAPYQAFRCKDGHFVMAAGNDDLFRRACEGFRLSDLAPDSRFSTTALRAQNQSALKDIVEKACANLTAEQCLGIARKHGVPCAPINTYSQALADAWSTTAGCSRSLCRVALRKLSFHRWRKVKSPEDRPSSASTPRRCSGSSRNAQARRPQKNDCACQVQERGGKQHPAQEADRGR
jgi:crotonobetainyl-CoA:carnitine CoA-transferase CaiB-like acyl-CoA transferase